MTIQKTIYRLLLAGLLLALLVLPVVSIAANGGLAVNNGSHFTPFAAEKQDIPAAVIACDPGGSSGGSCGG